MKIFQRIRSGFQRASERARGAFSRIFKPKAPEVSGIIQRAALTPNVIREKKRKEVEWEAQERALNMIRYGMENPDDDMAQTGKDKAIEYLNRVKELSGQGKNKDFQRIKAAERWNESYLSSEEGQRKRFAEGLLQMNANLDINLTPERYKTLKDLAKTDAFKKLKEIYASYYKEIYGAVAEEVENRVDPVRIEQTLDLFRLVGMNDFEVFTDIVNMDTQDYGKFMEETKYLYKIIPEGDNISDAFNEIVKSYFKEDDQEEENA